MRLVLSNPRGGPVVGDGSTSVIKILNDDFPVILSAADAIALEGDAGTTQMVFNFRLSARSGKVVTVDYTTEDGNASAPQDFMPTSGHLVFNPGETAKQVGITVNGDTEPEPNETFTLSLSNPTN